MQKTFSSYSLSTQLPQKYKTASRVQCTNEFSSFEAKKKERQRERDWKKRKPRLILGVELTFKGRGKLREWKERRLKIKTPSERLAPSSFSQRKKKKKMFSTEPSRK